MSASANTGRRKWSFAPCVTLTTTRFQRSPAVPDHPAGYSSSVGDVTPAVQMIAIRTVGPCIQALGAHASQVSVGCVSRLPGPVLDLPWLGTLMRDKPQSLGNA